MSHRWCYLDVAPLVLLGCRTAGAIGMSLLQSCLDVAPTELFGCRSSGAIWMSLLRSYLDVAPMVLLGWRSSGAIYRVTAPEVRHHNKNIDGKGI